MKTRRSLTCVLSLAMVAPVWLSGCGGAKRPPAVAGAPTPANHPRPGAPTEAPQPVEAGPDIRQVDADVARGEEFSVSDAQSGEGGPLADIHFEYDQATLTDEARSTLEGHALWLQSHREAKVMVEGHCDERGTVEYNLALGERRARATRDYLVSLGVAAERLRIVSFGKERPLDPGSNEEAWAKNRRAHFMVSR